MRIHTGDIVICVNASGRSALTAGKAYSVTSVYRHGGHMMIQINGSNSGFWMKRFRTKDDIDKFTVNEELFDEI